MSDMGLNASIYEHLRLYADRFDCALVKLRSRDKAAADKARKDLAATLREIVSISMGKPGLRLVATLLRQELAGKLPDFEGAFEELAKTLDSRAPVDNDVAKLEAIATAIDKECLNAGARMRGRA